MTAHFVGAWILLAASMCYIVLSSAILATGHRILGAKEEIIINL
jgi:thiosulfate reductase cytochrome b subunit